MHTCNASLQLSLRRKFSISLITSGGCGSWHDGCKYVCEWNFEIVQELLGGMKSGCLPLLSVCALLSAGPLSHVYRTAILKIPTSFESGHVIQEVDVQSTDTFDLVAFPVDLTIFSGNTRNSYEDQRPLTSHHAHVTAQFLVIVSVKHATWPPYVLNRVSAKLHWLLLLLMLTSWCCKRYLALHDVARQTSRPHLKGHHVF